MYPYIVKAHYYDGDDTLQHIQVLIYASSAADAISQVEGRYIPSPEDIKAICAGDEGQLFEVPGHIAKILASGAGVYRDGLNVLETNEKIAKKLRADAETVAPREKYPEDIPFPQNPDSETVYCPR